MKSNVLSLLVLTFLLISGCTKDENDYDAEQYKNGKIEFSYSTLDATVSKDTTIVFEATGSNPLHLADYGFFDPSTGWCQMVRSHPDNTENRIILFFSGTDLNTLSLPYTFKPGDINMDAQINYVVDSQIITDDAGQRFSVNNTYAATSHSDSFELTILSYGDNRLKGTFKGEIQNQEGDILNVENGIFDIRIVEKQTTASNNSIKTMHNSVN